MLKEFRDFVMRGNVIELAVAVLIATAFGVVIKSLIDNIIMPVVAALGGTPDFRDLTFTINDAVFRYGAFITDAITFIIVAAVVFFFVVRPFNAMVRRFSHQKDEEPTVTQEDLLAQIRDLIETQNGLLRK